MTNCHWGRNHRLFVQFSRWFTFLRRWAMIEAMQKERGIFMEHEKITVRMATTADLDQIAAVEAECFPPAEAATREEFQERLAHYGDHFWLMFEGDRLISFVDGFVTDCPDLADEMYADAAGHDEAGAWQMIFGVNTVPDRRGRGCAGALIRRAISDARRQGRKGLVLTCKAEKIPYYAKFGFEDEGVSGSTHGGVVWNQMRLTFWREHRELLAGFVAESRDILGENLVGIYLHGSAVMDCFNWDKSDLDLLVVVEREIPDPLKRVYLDMVAAYNEQAPAKGLELSIVRRECCSPFVYPTPFELHFSVAHLGWYRSDPEDYVAKMKGTDKDLAAHITVLRHRGQALYGPPIETVFAPVQRAAYFDSIWNDIAEAETEILENPMYITLNLCRVLAYGRDGLVLSKKEGGRWGLQNLPEKYHGLLRAALSAYASDEEMTLEFGATDFARYMLEKIRETE